VEGGEAMSMLSSQAKELRTLAGCLRKLYENGANLTRVQDAGMTTAVEVMCEAADTIESLRDRLQDAEDARYDAGFENGVKACLQQLDGLIVSGYDLKAVCTWIDNQWEVDA
jgi:hypothetical protein